MSLLDIEDCSAYYGDLQALYDVSLSVDEGETVAIIGANGAGKSTLLRAIAGLHRFRKGRLEYDGQPIGRTSAFRRVRAGISLVPEGRRIFPSLSVAENLQVGAHVGRTGVWNAESVKELFPILAQFEQRGGGVLSGGEQQALAIARALMANPRLLLLDEVSLGLAPIVVGHLYAAIPRIRAAGTTILLVEQNTDQALVTADRFYCLLEGRISLAGRPKDFARAQIAGAYFGVRTG